MLALRARRQRRGKTPRGVNNPGRRIRHVGRSRCRDEGLGPLLGCDLQPALLARTAGGTPNARALGFRILL